MAVSETVMGHFERVTEPLLQQPNVTRSTMMGFPCVRVDGRFFASVDRATGQLLVKLPAERVDSLIAEGRGASFAPGGKRFREWVDIAPEESEEWPAFLDEARAFVSS